MESLLFVSLETDPEAVLPRRPSQTEMTPLGRSSSFFCPPVSVCVFMVFFSHVPASPFGHFAAVDDPLVVAPAAPPSVIPSISGLTGGVRFKIPAPAVMSDRRIARARPLGDTTGRYGAYLPSRRSASRAYHNRSETGSGVCGLPMKDGGNYVAG